ISAICEHNWRHQPLTTISTGRGEPTPTWTSTCSTWTGCNSGCDSTAGISSTCGVGCSPELLTIVNGEQALRIRVMMNASTDKDFVFMRFSFYCVSDPQYDPKGNPLRGIN